MKFLFPVLFIPIFLYSYTLDELIELSHKNRVVESATHSLSAKEKAYESSKSSYLPTLELGATYQNVYEETAALAENSLRVQASFKYTLYDGGKKGSLYNQLESSIDASKQNVEATKNNISLDVARLYFGYLSLESDKEATSQEIEQLKAEFKRLDLFYKSGSATKDEVDKIDSRLKNSVVMLNEIELESQRILYTLEYYTTQKIQKIDEGSVVALNEQEKTLRADIEALEYDALSVLHEAKTKKSENLPKIYFDNTLSYSEYYFDDKSLESDFLVDTQNIAMLNLTWNVFDFGARTKAYESKFQEYLSKKSTLEHEKHRADVEYRFAKKALEIARLKVDATKATLDAASSTYELVKFKYQNGTIDNVAYLESMSEKYDAARGYKRALLDLEVKKAELIYYSGKDIKEFL
ncbi:MAG: TolC family protein [Sulfurimonas sp.]|uniref:TolC family protein n=1 Tax=Sulfurimonas sp. TaxID=2022749 RepID=UPI0028CC527F|nr:TolC family protein [Sulfurimonas sp.]MDT8339742.1 TolC family protein [Sulfurimonas sp.]